MKSEFPVTLLIRGKAQAYSEEQIRDRAKQAMSEVIDCIFDTLLPYHLEVGAGAPIDTGMLDTDLRDRIAYRLYWNDRRIKRQLAKELDSIAKQLYDESGIIFKDVKAINAAIQLKAYTNKLKAEVAHPGDGEHHWFKPEESWSGDSLADIIKDPEILAAYREKATNLMRNTFNAWNSSIIVQSDLMKEVRKGETDILAESE